MRSQTITAEVSGTVCNIGVVVGDTVKPDQELVIIESMKMEIPVVAVNGGVVRKIFIDEGEAVTEGQDLVLIEVS